MPERDTDLRVLIVKTSSLGDVVHTLPALTDAAEALPNLYFDWVVEEAFAPIPAWHPAVVQVIPVALRRWRKAPFSRQTREQWHEFRHRISAADYDVVIDAQGLLKSAWLARLASGARHGLDRHSAREGLAALSYQHRHHVPRGCHAIERVRELFASVLGYAVHHTEPDYGIFTGDPATVNSTLVFLHATSWPSKHWPEEYWQELVRLAAQAGYRIALPWGTENEHQRSERLAASADGAYVPEAMDLNEIAALLASARGAVAVDTGLGHLAAALSLPTVSLYGPTDSQLTGTRGHFQAQLHAGFGCAPCLQRQCTFRGASNVKPACFETVTPAQAWQTLQELINQKDNQ